MTEKLNVVAVSSIDAIINYADIRSASLNATSELERSISEAEEKLKISRFFLKNLEDLRRIGDSALIWSLTNSNQDLLHETTRLRICAASALAHVSKA